MKRLLYIAVLLVLTGCSGARDNDRRDTITVSIAPLRYLVEAITGDDFRVEVLIPAGASPETFEPTARQIATMADSRAVYTVGLIPFEQSLIARNRDITPIALCEGIETLGGHSHDGHSHGVDPHIWTSPRELRTMAANLHQSLKRLFPDSTVYDIRYKELDERLAELDQYISERISASGTRYFLIYHPALTYYARNYGIEQVAIEQEGREPSAKHITRIIEQASHDSIGHVLYQRPYPATVVGTVTEGIGAEAVEIDPLAENIDSSLRSITAIITSKR